MVSSTVLSGLAFVIVSLWQFGMVSAQENEAAITLIPSGFSQKAEVSPFLKLNKPKFFKPSFLTIQKIGLEAVPFEEVSLDEKNRLEAPLNFDNVGWFKDGVKSGEPGNAVIDGHYDKKDGSPAVFFNLGKVSVGDILNITDERETKINFEVYSSSLINLKDPVAAEVAYAEVQLNLLTIPLTRP